MRVLIIRHGKVDLSWSRYSTSEGFDRDCAEYDKAGVIDEGYQLPEMKCAKVYISSLSRTRDTARLLFKDEEFVATKLTDEVPLGSAFDTKAKLPLWFWNVAGRLQWAFNSSRQKEGRTATKQRARQFIEMICEKKEDCAVVTHGFFMHTLIKEMKRAGFTTGKSGMHYSNGDCIIAETD